MPDPGFVTAISKYEIYMQKLKLEREVQETPIGLGMKQLIVKSGCVTSG
jgi:translation elongation factor EF-1beta